MFKILKGVLVAAISLGSVVALMHELEPGQETFEQTVANHSMMFAYGAYCPNEELKAWNCKLCKEVPGFQVDTVYENGDLQAFTGWDPDYQQIVVSFRGTCNPGNWITDFDAFQVEYPRVNGSLVHQGFYNAWTNILKPEIMPSMQKLMDRHFGSQILVTGHSMGGSVSLVAALDIFHYANVTGNPGHRRTEHFGTPRWCNPVLVDYFMSLVDSNWRVVNVHDIAPKVPPFAYNYRHTPREVHYTSDSPLKYELCDGSGEDSECGYWQASVRDHLNYLNVPCCCKEKTHYNTVVVNSP